MVFRSNKVFKLESKVDYPHGQLLTFASFHGKIKVIDVLLFVMQVLKGCIHEGLRDPFPISLLISGCRGNSPFRRSQFGIRV